MEIKLSKYSGYCYGVKRALSIVEETLKDNSNNNIKVFTLGSVIHNPGVVKDLTKNGLIPIKNIDETTGGNIFIIKSITSKTNDGIPAYIAVSSPHFSGPGNIK